MDLNETPSAKVNAIYAKYFSLKFFNTSMQDKMALIGLICYVTNELNKKRHAFNKISCYKVICKIGSDFPEFEKNTMFKSLGAICEDFLRGSEEISNFGVKPKDMPKEILRILNTYVPF